MEKVTFDNYGISGEFSIDNEGELLALTPYRHIYTWCDGQNVDSLSGIAVSDKGKRFKLQQTESASYAENYEPDWEGDPAPTIGEQVAALRGKGQAIKYLILHRYDRIEDYEEYHILSDSCLDLSRIRRRLEDHLRKDTAAMLKAAVANNIRMA